MAAPLSRFDVVQEMVYHARGWQPATLADVQSWRNTMFAKASTFTELHRSMFTQAAADPLLSLLYTSRYIPLVQVDVPSNGVAGRHRVFNLMEVGTRGGGGGDAHATALWRPRARARARAGWHHLRNGDDQAQRGELVVF